MQPLPRDFLTDIAREYMLSPEQEAAFVELYSGNGDEFEVCEQLNLSHSALRTRMTGVYGKFSIKGKGPGKFYRLQNFLLQRHQSTGEPLQEVAPTVDIPALAQDCRQKVKPLLQERCGTMRVLDMEQPIGLGQIYTSVNILEKLTGRRRLELSDFLQEFDPADFERVGLGGIREQRVPGLEVVQRCQKLMVLGRPGAGKTTFLKYLAIACCGKTVLADHLPIFVPLKEFAETKGQPELLKYILWMFEDVSLSDLSLLLQDGKIFFLLDGLDEVREEDAVRVTREIQAIADKHPANHYIVTCRIAARDYIFQQFTEVEVADFDEQQIAEFARKWFHLKRPEQAEKFVKRLKENKRIRELATNPLLLTLLCLIFEERGKFKDSRAELYGEGIELLLEKWDDSRDIEREQVYRQLRPQRKMELLSHIALNTFAKNEYFFKKKTLEHLISAYIQNLPDVQNDPDGLLISSGKVLKTIVAQHGLLTERARGIYSFSHLTFQEYFVARQIANSNPEAANQHLHSLVAHITEKRWREVFLLVPEILPNASSLMKLMKAQVDSLLAEDARLQEFLHWLSAKQSSVKVPYKSSAVRAFYFALTHDYERKHGPNFAEYREYFHSIIIRNRSQTYTLARDLDNALNRNLSTFRILDRDHVHALNRDRDLNRAFQQANILNEAYTLDQRASFDHNRDRTLALILVFDRMLAHSANPTLVESLQSLKEQLPDLTSNFITCHQWWTANGKLWVERLKAIIIEHCDFYHNWQFSNEQKERLQQYYDANKLLIECLNGDCYVTNDVRAEIEDTLLLPISEIEKRQSE